MDNLDEILREIQKFQRENGVVLSEVPRTMLIRAKDLWKYRLSLLWWKVRRWLNLK